jgi:hypothetical protein
MRLLEPFRVSSIVGSRQGAEADLCCAPIADSAGSVTMNSAPPFGRLRTDAWPPWQFHQVPDDGKAKPCASGRGPGLVHPIEPFEDAREILLGNTRPGIRHGHHVVGPVVGSGDVHLGAIG